MLLNSVTIQNLCQHELVQHHFQPGLIGVMGPSGSGKSNYVQLIKASLTNDFSFGGTPKAAKVLRGCDMAEAAYVETTWGLDGSEFSVMRSLNPSKSELSIGTRTLNRANEVAMELRKIVGLSPFVVDNYVFVDQWEIFKFLREKPAERITNFAHLCGAAKAEELWQLLGQQISRDQQLAFHDQDTLDTVAAQLAGLQAATKESRSRVNSLKPKLIPKSELKDTKSLVERHRERIKMATQLEVQAAGLKQKRAEIATLLEARKKLEGPLEKARDDRRRHEPHYREASEKLRDWESLKRKYDRRDTLERDLLRLEKTRPNEPERTDSQGDEIDQARATLASEEARVAEITRILGELEADGVTACPICATPVSDLGDYLDNMAEERERLLKSIAVWEDEIEAYTAWRHACIAWNQAASAHDREMAKARGQLEELKDLPELLPKKFLQDEVTKHCELEEAVADLEVPMTEIMNKLAVLRGSIETLETQHAEYRKRYEDMEVTSSTEYDEALKRLASHEQNLPVFMQAKATLKAQLGQVEEKKALLDRLYKRAALAERCSDWVQHLESMRQVVHRNAFPQVYLQAVLHELERAVNENLDDFGGPFRVATNSEDLSFTVINRDGTTEPASAKSGGESVVLALAYRLAVSARFAAQVGIMVLDEPTAGLDEYYLGCLADVLLRVNEITQKRRQQLVLITHDQRLERVFDQMVEFA